MVCGSVKLYSMREVVEVLAALRLGLGPHSCPVLGWGGASSSSSAQARKRAKNPEPVHGYSNARKGTVTVTDVNVTDVVSGTMWQAE